MAEILIKGMEMPKTCADCRFAIDSYGSLTECKCAVLGFGIYKYMTRCTKLERHEDCPLVEIALERDTPKVPVLKDGESLVHLSKADGTGEFRSSKWLHWTCPVCGGFVGELYVYEGVRHIQRNTPYCAQCGQKIDWDTPRNEIRRQEEN